MLHVFKQRRHMSLMNMHEILTVLDDKKISEYSSLKVFRDTIIPFCETWFTSANASHEQQTQNACVSYMHSLKLAVVESVGSPTLSSSILNL